MYFRFKPELGTEWKSVYRSKHLWLTRSEFLQLILFGTPGCKNHVILKMCSHVPLSLESVSSDCL